MDLIEQCAKLAAAASELHITSLLTLPSVRERTKEQQAMLDAMAATQHNAINAWRLAKLTDPEWSPTKEYPRPMDYRSAA